MGDFRGYILSFIGAAMICGVIKNFIGPTSKAEGLINILCGLFMALTVLSPIIDIEIPRYSSNIQSIYATAEQISREGASTAGENMSTIIKDEVQAYILEKASSLNMDIDVEVALNEEGLVPANVVVIGSVSPYEKALLQNYILKTLDIPEERQLWKE